MAYNPYSAVNAIYHLKEQWDDAYNAGNTTKQNQVAQKAQQYYKELYSNGYNDVADQLQASDYKQAKNIHDKWSATDKTSTRDYFYTLGKAYGMSESDIDNLISWNDTSKQVSFGGKVIGTPDAIVDGVSYWNDTSVLDNAFKDYTTRTNMNLSDAQLSSKNSTEINDKINQLWGIQTNNRNTMADKYNNLEKTAYSNPFSTEEAKAILAKYDLAGLQGRDNAVASGGASNGGNIDSYAAANALRQQASLANMGQMAVLEAHNNKINNVKGILENLGVYQQNQDLGMQNTIESQQKEAQRLFENDQTAKNTEFENDQTAKNNEVDNLVKQADVTGNTPIEWVIKNNATFREYLNPDGSFKKEKENVNIQERINAAKARGDEQTANDLAVVRQRKISGNYDAFGQFANEGDLASMKSVQTEAGRQFDKQDDTSRLAVTVDADTKKYEIDADIEKTKDTNATQKDISYHADDTNLAGTKYTTDAQERMHNSSLASEESKLDKTLAASKSSSSSNTESSSNTSSNTKASTTVESVKEKADKAVDIVKDTVTNKAIADEMAEKLNKQIANEYGSGYKALKKDSNGKYKPADAGAEYVIVQVMKSDLSDETKESLLFDYFGITESQANDVLKDKHYK